MTRKTKDTVALTNFGFDWGEVAIEKCFERDGYKCIRIRHMGSCKFIDVQVSPSGRKLFAYNLRNGLKGFNPCGGKKLL